MTHQTGVILLSVIFVFAGLLSVTASLCNWDWFFNSRNSRMLTGQFSRKISRIIYLVLGVFILVMAYITVKPLIA